MLGIKGLNIVVDDKTTYESDLSPSFISEQELRNRTHLINVQAQKTSDRLLITKRGNATIIQHTKQKSLKMRT